MASWNSEGSSLEHHIDPEPLPGGRGVLFTIKPFNELKSPRVAVMDLDTRQAAVLVNGATARYSASGHLLYVRMSDATLMAAPFDLEHLRLTGSAVPIVSGIFNFFTLYPSYAYSVSAEGTLIYETGFPHPRPVVVGPEGERTWDALQEGEFLEVDISPDGKHLAFSRRVSRGAGEQEEIVVFDLPDGPLVKVTSDGRNRFPSWMPDNRSLTIISDRAGDWGLYRIAADGSRPAEQLIASLDAHDHVDWLADGSGFLFATAVDGSPGIALSNRDDAGTPEVLLHPDNATARIGAGASFPRNFALSPDGRWLAYVDDFEVLYVVPFPELGAPIRVSKGWGSAPAWSSDGKVLYYRGFAFSEIVAAEVRTDPSFWVTDHRVVYRGPVPSYAPLPDGSLVVLKASDEDSQLVVILNWFEELKRLVPTESD